MTSVREFSEMLLCCDHIGFVSSLLREKTAEINQFPIDPNGCLPAEFLRICPFERSASFPPSAIGGIPLTIGESKIDDSIITSSTVNMINPLYWHASVDIEPRDVMCDVKPSIQENVGIPMSRSAWFHDPSPVSSDKAAHFSGFGIIENESHQAFMSEVGGFVLHALIIAPTGMGAQPSRGGNSIK